MSNPQAALPPVAQLQRLDDREIGPWADFRFQICDFRIQQIHSSCHLTLPIADTGECVTRGVCPSVLPVFAPSDIALLAVILSPWAIGSSGHRAIGSSGHRVIG
ncbi:MAG: hypothetical protein ABSA59_12445 [Terriglobia bacterium]|jgi:hypothetical protein